MWCKVIFLLYSKFDIFRSKRRQYVHAKARNHVYNHQSNMAEVQIWDCTSGAGDLVLIKGIMNC